MGKRSKTALELLHYLFRKPVVNVKQVQEKTGLSAKAANDLVKEFLNNGILREITGFQRNRMFVFDEYTSVVDREVAKIGSFAIQKAIRKTNKKFIAVTCHFDIIDWLLPDWIFYTDTMTFQSFEGQKKK